MDTGQTAGPSQQRCGRCKGALADNYVQQKNEQKKIAGNYNINSLVVASPATRDRDKAVVPRCKNPTPTEKEKEPYT